MQLTLYRHDGSWEGLLCAVAAALEHGNARIEASNADGPGLFGGTCAPADPERAVRLVDRLVAAGGTAAIGRIMDCFLADVPNLENDLVTYVRRTLAERRNMDGCRQDDAIRRILTISQKVGHEAHRMLGLLRFQELADGTLYAPYEPDHNITLRIGGHFRSRLRSERWVIHDRRRNLAVMWTGSQLLPVCTGGDQRWDALARQSRGEMPWQDRWRAYTRNIAIQERKNPALQRQFMPARYWKYLPEMTPATTRHQ